MKKFIVIPALFAFFLCFGQNVKLEIIDYHKELEGKIYSTYQFAQASYSYSRSSLVVVTSKSILLDLSRKIPQCFKMKQEYTDVWILGIDQLNKNYLTEVDKKVVDSFFKKIIKYRLDNGLPGYTLEELNEKKIFLKDAKDLCKYIACGKQL